MNPRGIHHIGHAVDDLPGAVERYQRLLGARVEHRETVPEQGVEAVALRVGDSLVELLAPLAEDTPVGRFLAKRGAGMHHVAYLVDDIDGRAGRCPGSGGGADRRAVAGGAVRPPRRLCASRRHGRGAG